MATTRPSSPRPRRLRIVKASSSACVGCSCMPSPAFTTAARVRPRDVVRRARRRVSNHDHVGVHRVDRRDGVAQRLALARARRRAAEVHDVGAEALAGELEARARARRGLEEQVDDRLRARACRACRRDFGSTRGTCRPRRVARAPSNDPSPRCRADGGGTPGSRAASLLPSEQGVHRRSGCPVSTPQSIVENEGPLSACNRAGRKPCSVARPVAGRDLRTTRTVRPASSSTRRAPAPSNVIEE